jgi:hypothetical protein
VVKELADVFRIVARRLQRGAFVKRPPRPALVFAIGASLAGLLGGCTTQEAARNVYEGTRNRNEALKSRPEEDSSPRTPSYEEYERERRALREPGR